MISLTETKVDIGGNPSTEGDAGSDEDAAPAAASAGEVVNNVIHAFSLQEMQFDRKSFAIFIKDYMKVVIAYLEKKNPARIDAFKAAATVYVKKMMEPETFSGLRFYSGESMDPEGAHAILFYRDEKPIMHFFADGLKAEKV